MLILRLEFCAFGTSSTVSKLMFTACALQKFVSKHNGFYWMNGTVEIYLADGIVALLRRYLSCIGVAKTQREFLGVVSSIHVLDA
jgi:hypothetical protein